MIPSFLEARRSIRSFRATRIGPERLDPLVVAAATAPAPHHSRPWRFAIVDSAAAKSALASEMAARWQRDLEGDRVEPRRIEALLHSSRAKITSAPGVILACLTDDGLDRYPDEARARAEWSMAVLSLGAAVENLMLAATDAGLASCWMAAPVFCPPEARDALRLPPTWVPQALVLLGEPDPTYRARARPPIDLDGLRVIR